MGKATKVKFGKAVGFNVGVIVVLLVLTFAQIDSRIAPFAFAFLFACLYLNVNKPTVGICAFLFSLFIRHDQLFILANALGVALFFLLWWLIPKLKAQYHGNEKFEKYYIEYVIVFVVFALSHVMNIAGTSYLEGLFTALISMLVGLVFLAACLVFINAVKTRWNKIPWTIDQKVCAGVFVVILSLGLMGFNSEFFNLHKFLSVLLILCTATMLDARSTFIVAICMGLGGAFVDLNLVPIAVYGLFAITAIAFRARVKYYSIVAVMMTELVLGFYFRAYGDYDIFQFLPVAMAGLLVIALPRAFGRHFDFSKSFLSGYLVSKNTINKNRQGINKRLENLASVFNEMQNIYKNLVKGSLPPEESAKMMARTLADNVCENCENRPNCRRNGGDGEAVTDAFEKLCYIGLKRGSVNFLDLPSNMSFKCTKLNTVLTTANNYIATVQTQAQSRGKLDASKVLMAGLLSGLSRLCVNFANDLGSEVVFDLDKAEDIKDALLSAGIVASDCLITKSKSGEYNVSVLVSRRDAQNLAIERVISKVCSHKMQIDTIDDAETAGFAIVTCKTSPRYKLVFGVAQVAKDFNPQNGDSFSFLKVTSDRTMMALCDGMGSGARANRASVLAISLIENFYKAGFSHEIIMESVNQLLIMTEQEDFSAIDIAVFSLNDGMVNFIKVGGVEGFIKRSSDVEVIEAGSLPLGIVEEMVPKITRAHIMQGEMVVLVSDGVTDSFNDRVALASFINNSHVESPQKLADEVVAECLRRTDKIAIDDITVIVARME